MKKRISYLVIVFVLMLSTLYIENTNVDASGKIVYETFLSQIIKFEKSNGKLIVKTKIKWGEGLGAYEAPTNLKGVKKKSLNLKIASDCKWSQSYIGAKSYAKYSYDAFKNDIKNSQSEDGEFEGVVQIFVKDKKVVRVNLMFT